MQFVTRQQTTAPLASMPPRLQRWQRLMLATVAGLLSAGIIIFGLLIYTSGQTYWGITFSSQGPQSACYPVTCQTYEWQITRVALGSLGDNNSLQPGSVVCGYIDTHGRSIDIKPGTSAQSINAARQLIVPAPGHDICDFTTTLSNGQVSFPAAISDLVIEIVCAALAVLVLLHGTRRDFILHTVVFLLGLILTFGLLSLITIGDPLLSVFSVIVTSCVTPTLLTTLTWRLVLQRPRRLPTKIVRWTSFSLLALVTAATSVALLVTLLLQARDAYNAISIVVTAVVAINLLITLGIVVYSSLFNPDPIQRDYARILGMGAVVGLVPPLVFAVLPAVDVNFHPIVDATTSLSSLGAFPLALAYVVLKRDLLRTDVMIRRTAIQGVWLIFLAFASALALSVMVGGFGLPSDDAAVLFIGLLIFGLVAPFLLTGARWLTEAGIFPEMRRYRRLIREARVGGQSEEHQIADTLIGEITFALPVRAVTLLVRHDDAGLFEVVGGADIPPITVNEPILARFVEGREALVRSDLTAFEPLPFAPPPAAQWECFVPIVLEQRLVGLLLLGPREDEIGYSTTDRTQIYRLANQRAVALDYLRVLTALRASLEEQKRIDALKDQFIMTAHHELRTPLTSMMGYIEIVSRLDEETRKQEPEEVEFMVGEALRSGEDLVHLLDTLLAADRATMRTGDLRPTYIALAETLRRLAQDAEMSGPDQQSRITVQCPPDLKGWADREAFSQVITNLLSNAIKYSPTGAPIEVAAHPSADERMVEVTVRDDGDGVPANQQTAIFEKFIRLERDLNSPIRGTGLGLAIVRDRVEAMGGKVWVESTGIPGEGSTFHVTIPTSAASLEDRSTAPIPAVTVPLPPQPVPVAASPILAMPEPESEAPPNELLDTLPRRKLVRFGPPPTSE